jgi:hypothetical protein
MSKRAVSNSNKKAANAKRQNSSPKVVRIIRAKAQKNKKRIQIFLRRRPHRSFVRTRKRDYERSLKLPGYFSFTWYVFTTLKKQRNTFLLLIVLSTLFASLLGGIASQDSFNTLSKTLNETGKNIFSGGGWGEIGKAGLLFFTTVSGGITVQPSEAQQIFIVFVSLLTWLATIWLLRAGLAGKILRLRDALYNSGSPIVPTTLLFALLLIQLIPAAFAVIGYTVAQSTDFLGTGAIAMLFFIVALLLIILSLYLITSTFFALVIITLPGMYPWQALRTSGDLVVGRRLRILLRVLWMVAAVIVLWTLIMVPSIAFFSWLQNNVTQVSAVPFIPVILALLSSATAIFTSSYIYLLYRKVVEDDASPA